MIRVELARAALYIVPGTFEFKQLGKALTCVRYLSFRFSATYLGTSPSCLVLVVLIDLRSAFYVDYRFLSLP